MKEIHKITYGFVTQRWNAKTNKFLGQEFTCGDYYEDEKGKLIEDFDEATGAPEPEYQPYDMVQPELREAIEKVLAVLKVGLPDWEMSKPLQKAIKVLERYS